MIYPYTLIPVNQAIKVYIILQELGYVPSFDLIYTIQDCNPLDLLDVTINACSKFSYFAFYKRGGLNPDIPRTYEPLNIFLNKACNLKNQYYEK